MPTILKIFNFRFMFYSGDHKPIHVHIEKGGCEAKFNVDPVDMVYNHGFKQHEISLIRSLVEENVDVITERWHEFFEGQK
ncbi:MAG: DUF4160 domain-containing protein [Bacteroidales bacterium]|nr:DUF4160 domain-containing protein [Bacteroidales bacterium]